MIACDKSAFIILKISSNKIIIASKIVKEVAWRLLIVLPWVLNLKRTNEINIRITYNINNKYGINRRSWYYL